VKARLGDALTQALLAKLDAAANHAVAGRPQQAVRKVEDYRDKLARNADSIEPDVAAALDAAAQQCIEELGA
jgi:alkanesulfonate monooxygenase SsuD/methylene tetrahydromethanopterin reductase-like flavin-dependent oxidoreductase (luciferase family)